MDIQKELKNLIYDNKSAYDLRSEIMQEKVKLEKKMHMIQAIHVTQKIEKAVKENFFHNFSSITYEIRFYSLNFSVNYVIKSKIKKNHNKNLSPEIKNFLDEFTLDISALDSRYKNQEKLNNINPEHTLELKLGIGEKMLDLFLSKELKNIVDYNRMQIDLPKNNESNSKKIKM